MKARVLLEPERPYRYFGRYQNRTVELEPAFLLDQWWIRLMGENGERFSLFEPFPPLTISDYLADNHGYDLRCIAWCDTLSRPYSYNPFLGKSSTSDNCSNVYFLQNIQTGSIKIGFSASYRNRMGNIKSQVKSELSLLGLIQGDRRAEEEVHCQLADYRSDGEWFSDCAPVREYIDKYAYLP